MWRLWYENYIYFLLVVSTFSCKVPYRPEPGASPPRYLVVEGTINSGSTDSTFIKLSRATKLDASVVNVPEAGAVVSVEDGQGFSVLLTYKGSGIYASGPLGLDHSKKYRLRIKTTANKTYLSDLQSVISTPPIDSVGFYNKDKGIQLYVNTHDPANNTRYYRWEFTETWKFSTRYESLYIADRTQGAVRLRTPAELLPKYCWGSDISTEVVLGSSIKLAQDVIYQMPLTYIDGYSEKIEMRYAILVKQYALTKEAYTYWELLKNNTEKLGTIFDAQPSAITGNIYCVEDPSERVLGYIGISDVQVKLAFFNKADMHILTAPKVFSDCLLDTVLSQVPGTCCPFRNDVSLILLPTNAKLIPVDKFFTPVIGYTATGIECVDCTTRGGIAPPPIFGKTIKKFLAHRAFS